MADPYDPNDPTRDEIGVNSPKGKKAAAWPSHLVTQVNEEDEKIRQLEMQARIKKQRKKGKDEDGQELLSNHINQLQTADQNRNGGCNPCRSCLRCFRTAPTPAAAGGPQEAGNGDAAISDPPNEVPSQNLPRGVQEVDQSGGSDESESEEAIEGLLPKQQGSSSGKKCLVLDLDETLVHSSFQPIECSFQVPIVIDGIKHDVFVLKRPYVDEFLKSVAKHFELVIFTASLSEYANPVLDVLDQEGVIEHRLFRESCVLHEGQAYVKDLSRLGRKLKDCIIVDNSPLSYLYDPQNAIGCTSWFGDPNDTELLDMCPILNQVLKKTSDVRNLLNANTQTYQSLVEDLTPENNYTGGKDDWDG